LQWQLQSARSDLESTQTDFAELKKTKAALADCQAALADCQAAHESICTAAQLVVEGLNTSLLKLAASKQLQPGASLDSDACDARLPWLKHLYKLALPSSSSVVHSIALNLYKLAAEEELPSTSTSSTGDTEVHLLKFKLRALAAQLSRAERCILESSPSSLTVQAEALKASNLALESKLLAAGHSVKTLTADRDEYVKRYSSLMSSFSQLSNLNNHIVREVVTLRRKLKAGQSGEHPDSALAEKSRDFDREVEEAANSFSATFDQAVLNAVDREAFRSAKKRSLMLEQNEHIAILSKELADLKLAHSALQLQLQDALDAAKVATVTAQQQQQQLVVNVPVLYDVAFDNRASSFTERSAEEEFLSIRLKAS
jgi:3-methyladenine DNA glycosylase AlkC